MILFVNMFKLEIFWIKFSRCVRNLLRVVSRFCLLTCLNLKYYGSHEVLKKKEQEKPSKGLNQFLGQIHRMFYVYLH